jgi:yecA family protein
LSNKKQSVLYWQDFIECAEYHISSKKLIKLHGFLRQKNTPKYCNSIANADGFLTALVIGPNMIRRGSKQGLEVIWGGKPPGIVSRGKLRHSRDSKMVNILGERLSLISYQLEHERSQYEPLTFNPLMKTTAPLDSEDWVPSIIHWCRGFMQYFNIEPQAWKAIFDADAHRLLTPIMFFGNDIQVDSAIRNGLNLRQYGEILTRHLPHYVFGIKDFFQTPSNVEDMVELLIEIEPNFEKYLFDQYCLIWM